ncbi:MAG TPA: 1,2-phenylacetyl-CoA epoxidase subunit A, partial [Bacteroidetes bacterium]|nr:1,2-phenylacetyl-CoA epoxidase subunit A [Bacteroidota bacterium]
MYGNITIVEGPTEEHHDDPEKLAAFEAKIDRGEKIEPHDWMPREYRRQLIRMI